jgi:uncharacterized HhH-GPD family protein
MATKKPQLYLSTDPEADKLLSEDPLALLVGMVLDQQIPLEKAFRGPYDLRERLGSPLDAGRIAAMSPDSLSAAFAERPSLHRFPASMAKRVQDMCQALVDHYGGDAAVVWTGATSGEELLARIRSLPGFGEQKAKIFVALLGKQLGVRPPGWEEAAGVYGAAGSFKSVADIDSAASLAKVREYKKAAKAQARSAASS